MARHAWKRFPSPRDFVVMVVQVLETAAWDVIHRASCSGNISGSCQNTRLGSVKQDLSLCSLVFLGLYIIIRIITLATVLVYD
jgi:hypothetical protein